MEFLGGIEGMKFNPISNYNNYLKNNMSFEVDSDVSFENILNKQQAAMSQNPTKIQGGVAMNADFENILAQNVTQADSASMGNFAKSISGAFGNGLNSVNDSINASHKAQEAMAMGENVSVHDVMIASEKAALNMQMAIQVRNKLLQAYTEINNVRV